MLKEEENMVDRKRTVARDAKAWAQLRGSAKDIFAELGGGEAYLRGERSNFYSSKTNEKDCGG